MKDNFETANAPEPGKPWVFDKNVADSFDHMLQNSIPGYNDMRDIIYRLGRPVAGTKYDLIIDLGASTGESIAQFVKNEDAHGYMLTDISTPMLEKMSARFADRDDVLPLELDLRKRSNEIYDALGMTVKDKERDVVYYARPNLVLAILTLIFVPINFRPNILRGVYQSLRPGGKFIITEKLQGSDWLMDNLLVDTYHEYKHDNGYSWEAIERKRLSLEGTQVPLTERANVDMLHRAGFDHVECVHRHMNFATFLAIKDE